MILLYFIGIIFAITAALIFRRTLFKGEPVPFVMELPNYRMPGIKKCGSAFMGKSERLSPESLHHNLSCYNRHMGITKF